MPISRKKQEAIIKIVDSVGISNAMNMLGVSKDTLKRYLRKISRSGDEDSASKKHAKVLFLDIETAPLKGFVWNRFPKFIDFKQIEEDWFILCWSAQWLDSDHVIGQRVSSEEAENMDDSRIIKPLWELLDEADVVVAHNGDHFDIPRIMFRFMKNGMKAPSRFSTIDTLKKLKGCISVVSYKLDDLCAMFGIEGKSRTDFGLWKKAKAGSDESLDAMLDYNKNDVVILKKLYMLTRSWYRTHPILYFGSGTCRVCGSNNLTHDTGTKFTDMSVYKMTKCEDCGFSVRGKKPMYRE